MKQHFRQSGQSMTEFIIVTPILIMLIFGSLQFALIYRAKITLNYATFQAARAGAFNNGSRIMMENALTRTLAALYTRSTTPGNDEGEIMWARERVRTEIEDGFLWVQVLNPTPTAFSSGFALTDDNGDQYIPNDNLMYRNQYTSDGLSIQDANLLQIRVSYCHRMIVPYMDRLLAILMTQSADPTCPQCTGAFTSADTFERSCFNNRRFPIHAHSIMRMQSPANQAAIDSTISPHSPTAATPTTTTTFTPWINTGFWTLSSSRQP